MALISWLMREGFGSYASVDEFVGELARRSSSAIGALGAAVYASVEDLAEAAKGPGQAVCTELVRDLRVVRGARLAALRAVLTAGAGAELARLYAGASDLLADVRLAEADRLYICKQGLKAFLESLQPQTVSMEVLRGAATCAESARVLGADAVRDLLGAAPADHTGAITLRHAALAGPLPADLEKRWIEALAKQCRAARGATPAAKRLGTAPEWPPVLPEAMKGLLPKAEAAMAAAPAPGKGAPAKAPAKAAEPEIPKPASRPGLGAPVRPGEAPPPPRGPGAPDLRPEAVAAVEAPPTPKVQAPLRARGRGAVIQESFAADSKPVPMAALRSRPAAPAPEAEAAPDEASVGDPSRRRPPPLRSLRFGEQVELVATRGVRAVERLMATFDARANLVGLDRALVELHTAAEARGRKDVSDPVLDELETLATDPQAPSGWRRAVKTVLLSLAPERAAALGFASIAP